MTSKKMDLTNHKVKRISEILLPNFHNLYTAWRSSQYTRYVCKGGRASAKSSHIALILVLSLMREPVNVVVLRKVAETLRTSVYEQIKWAIQELGVEDYFIFKTSPMEIIYAPRGNKFLFFGVDDPNKRKSMKTAEFPIAYFWIEEAAEFSTEEEIEIVIKSVLRGKISDNLKYKGFLSYNPPKQRHHWINKKYGVIQKQETSFIHHSCYIDNPYLSEEFILEADEKKKKDSVGYDWEYLGKPVGGGVVPFPHLHLEKIPDSLIRTLDTFRNGVDWGYAVDPVAFVRWGYDRMRKRIYAISEFYGVQKSNEVLAKAIKKQIKRNETVTCDSAEPKSVAELRTYGIRAYSAKKGKGSVESGEKWLGEMEIYIDPERTPNIAREFQLADYDIDRYGETVARLADIDNHTIDATRYAFEGDLKKRREANSKKFSRPSGL
ncbi:PBSX family phage terminase large subunit [Fusobacterium necrophorum]|uniref:Phage terminase, large subunit, PBSX family n=3 Tax=Fusobacterium necrophorum TaxID=859 RepID=A0AAN4ATR8_9FUSO|nr:PBSX family phage terminase large subunit [Fusobacterium necrophorum]AYV94654.1 PBSX family phage terminase large subunit [Fusobacterium necrophorum subsp. funduliforme]EJU18743.1 phage terminase, large subunit, PBSX family [Fusobacterium necrophorum subsp. funduliforme Fnf 1007]KYL03336.1 terminase [Fusobacterium necrophorum subsp. funduliforme]KYM40870.1 terminase [Fusobacterium necrophorum subsp. funduliforme]KYM50777.1 terminase [Fusobacterium necrophorum subsp. funduliforme]